MRIQLIFLRVDKQNLRKSVSTAKYLAQDFLKLLIKTLLGRHNAKKGGWGLKINEEII